MQPEVIQKRIYQIRGYNVMIDFDLAELYDVETKRLKESVKRNIDRFPPDFMFELSKKEFENLRSQYATSKRGGTRYMPFAFTEQGVAMLASVLNSTKAIQINIDIMRAFVFLRKLALSHHDISEKLKELESKYNQQFSDVFDAINYLLNKDKQELEQKERRKIGLIK
jgi:phage regulator Rha-like protein